ncbi:HNH endonuclease signature motif containing protein [Streptomyces sp. NPDC046465]|uniref:HNH endonuclease signature motif containing protein n=1 Tax=Streptomyces sp. NPDC046465 TaxID=3155810 RepID=UPI0033C2F147
MSKYPRESLVTAAAVSTSLVDLMRRLGAPMGSGPRSYLRERLIHYAVDTSHFVAEALPERPSRSYSQQVLARAAACSTSIREMFVHMGIPPEDGPYGHVAKKLRQFGIDTGHFVTPRAAQSTALFPEEEFTRAVAASHGLADLMRRLGLPAFGQAGRARAKRSIDEYGLSTEHFVGQGHSIGLRPATTKSAAQILVRLDDGSPRTRTRLLRRALDESRVPRRCAECGLGEIWQGKRLVLEIDHVNGDRLDNRPGNLRYLCPSCHSQTATFGNRTRSSPRG